MKWLKKMFECMSSYFHKFSENCKIGFDENFIEFHSRVHSRILRM